jgi:hypothetical protein
MAEGVFVQHKVIEDEDGVATVVAVLDAGDEAVSSLTDAARAHDLSAASLTAVGADERVHVFLAQHRSGAVAAIATLANDLDAMPLVSPDFFRARWPEHYDAGRCWYVGLVGVRPSEQGGGAFQLIVGTVASTLGPRGGVLVLDVPQRNIEAFHVPNAVKRIADAVVRDVSIEMVDAQTYWAYTTPVPAEIDLREPATIDVRDTADLRDRSPEASRRPATER